MPTACKTPPAHAALRRYAPPVVLAAAMLFAFAQGWHHNITLENVVAQRERFHHFLAEHAALSLLVYMAIYVLSVTLSLPCGLILTAAGGLLFGWMVGALAAVVAATTGATAVFLIARSAVGDALGGRAAPWLAKLSDGFQKDALSYMLFLRLVPAFPFWFVNLAPAVLGVPLKTFVVGTFFGIIPATLAFACAGAGLDSVILAARNEYAACVAMKGLDNCALKIQASSLLTKELILALVLIGIVALIPVILKRWRKADAAAK